METDNKKPNWIIVCVIAVVVLMFAGELSDMLGINMRSARYLVLVIIFLVWYIVDVIRNRKK